MSAADLFYIVAIIFMIVHLFLLIAGMVVVYRIVQGLQKSVHRVEQVISSVSIAKYSLQMTLLKNLLKFFGRGGERT